MDDMNYWKFSWLTVRWSFAEFSGRGQMQIRCVEKVLGNLGLTGVYRHVHEYEENQRNCFKSDGDFGLVWPTRTSTHFSN